MGFLVQQLIRQPCMIVVGAGVKDDARYVVTLCCVYLLTSILFPLVFFHNAGIASANIHIKF